jgi:hypothetical protein
MAALADSRGDEPPWASSAMGVSGGTDNTGGGLDRWIEMLRRCELPSEADIGRLCKLAVEVRPSYYLMRANKFNALVFWLHSFRNWNGMAWLSLADCACACLRRVD